MGISLVPVAKPAVVTGGREVIVDFPSQTIAAGGNFDAIEARSSGALDEFMILSPNTNFAVAVSVDGTTILSKTYAEFHAITQTLKCVSAFPELDENGVPTGNYLVHLADISFLKSLVVRVLNTGGTGVTFNIFGKYTLS